MVGVRVRVRVKVRVRVRAWQISKIVQPGAQGQGTHSCSGLVAISLESELGLGFRSGGLAVKYLRETYCPPRPS